MPKWSRQHPISIRQKKSRSLLYFAVARWRCWKMSRLRTSIREKNNRGLLWRHSYRTKGLFLSKWDCSSSCIFLRISYLMFALQKIHWSRRKRINTFQIPLLYLFSFDCWKFQEILSSYLMKIWHHSFGSSGWRWWWWFFYAHIFPLRLLFLDRDVAVSGGD